DQNGILVFHHVGYSPFEFSGSGMLLFHAILVGDDHSPQYWCCFMYRGQEVDRVRYNDLASRSAEGLRTVTRPWKWTEWPYKILYDNAEGGETEAVRLKWFDKNGDGELDFEERCAYGAASWAALISEQSKSHSQAMPETVEFRLVERT